MIYFSRFQIDVCATLLFQAPSIHPFSGIRKNVLRQAAQVLPSESNGYGRNEDGFLRKGERKVANSGYFALIRGFGFGDLMVKCSKALRPGYADQHYKIF